MIRPESSFLSVNWQTADPEKFLWKFACTGKAARLWAGEFNDPLLLAAATLDPNEHFFYLKFRGPGPARRLTLCMKKNLLDNVTGLQLAASPRLARAWSAEVKRLGLDERKKNA